MTWAPLTWSTIQKDPNGKAYYVNIQVLVKRGYIFTILVDR